MEFAKDSHDRPWGLLPTLSAQAQVHKGCTGGCQDLAGNGNSTDCDTGSGWFNTRSSTATIAAPERALAELWIRQR